MAITSSNIHDGALNNPLDDRYIPVYASADTLPSVTTADNGRLAVIESTSGVYQVASGAWVFRGFLGVEGEESGSRAWGSITGDIEDQLDLASALDERATSAQGALADSAVQPGDNVTTLSSGAASVGQRPTADGAGGIAWETPAAGPGLTAPTELTASRELTDSDHDKVLYYDGSTAITVTLHDDASDGFECAIINAGSNTVTLATEGGDTLVPNGLVLDNSGTSELTIVSLLHNAGSWYGVSGTRTITSFVLALSDETTDLTAGTAKATLHWPYGFTVTDLIATLSTAATGSTVIVDMNVAGSTVLATRLSIDDGEDTSATATTPVAFSGSTTIAAGAKVTFDIDQVGSSTAGKGLKVAVIGYRW